MKKSAVLLITFSRPETTIEVLKSLRVAKPYVLYVFADGARNPEEQTKCDHVRNLVDEYVNWECTVYKKYMDLNLGCGPGPDTAIRWALEKEDRIIILEDDCVPSPAFFPYCDYLLEKYLDDERVWFISGNNYCPEYQLDSDYIFSNYAHSQGWATWRRCFLQNDLTMKNWPEFREKRMLESLLPKREATYFSKIYESTYRDKTKMSHVWDVQCGFCIRSNGGLGITPKSNLVKNIGYIGTHSESKEHFHDRPVDDSFVICKEPEFVVADFLHDRYHFQHHWRAGTGIRRLIKRAQKIFRKRIVSIQ